MTTTTMMGDDDDGDEDGDDDDDDDNDTATTTATIVGLYLLAWQRLGDAPACADRVAHVRSRPTEAQGRAALQALLAQLAAYDLARADVQRVSAVFMAPKGAKSIICAASLMGFSNTE